MWPRLAADRLATLWAAFPAVLILGARQVGKTTLARQCFPQLPYVDLEEPATRQLFTDDPTFQLEQRATAALVLDEAQAVPAVFAALRGVIDRRPGVAGRFLLLGSAQPTLVRQVSESLAGRAGIIDLDPLTAAEAGRGDDQRSWEDVWVRGGFPSALRTDFREWWAAYLRTYVERDLPHLGVGADPLLLRRLLTMLAHAQGGLLNASTLGRSLGVSYHTVSRYLDVLEQTFLVRRLPPYFRNVKKRLVKAPKVYLRDTGLLHHLLGLDSRQAIEHHLVHGASFETFVLEDVIRREKLAHPHSQFFFWRTGSGAEVDLVIDRGAERFLIEVKAGRGDKPDAVRTLAQCVTDTAARAAWIVDQAPGTDPLRSGIGRRGITTCLTWLPGEAASA